MFDRDLNIWQRILAVLQDQLDADEYRHWFESTAYASDSGDRIMVWAPSESIRRHIMTHHDQTIQQILSELGRDGTSLRIVVSGFDDDD